MQTHSLALDGVTLRVTRTAPEGPAGPSARCTGVTCVSTTFTAFFSPASFPDSPTRESCDRLQVSSLHLNPNLHMFLGTRNPRCVLVFFLLSDLPAFLFPFLPSFHPSPCLFFYFETASPYVAQNRLKLVAHLPQPSRVLGYRCVPRCPARYPS